MSFIHMLIMNQKYSTFSNKINIVINHNKCKKYLSNVFHFLVCSAQHQRVLAYRILDTINAVKSEANKIT